MNRYIQQIVIPEVGADGQKKMSSAKVLIVGAGGLGTPLAAYLSAAGIGHLGIADGDKVVESNLSRQFLFYKDDLGQSKSTVLISRLAMQNPEIKFSDYPDMLSIENATSMISEYDMVCDCTDNVDSRLLIDKICGELNKPLVYAVVRDWQAYITILHHQRRVSLDHIFSATDLREHAGQNCSVAGIINTTCGIAASVQGTEVLKIILGIESELDGGILCIDGLKPVFKILRLVSE